MGRFHEIQHGGHVIENSKWRACKLLRWAQKLNHLTWDHGNVYAVRSLKDNNF
jgi:hypothetical protein